MSKAPIMPFFIPLYMADTKHLTTEQHGAYILLMLHIWYNDCKPLPDDDLILAKITGFSAYKWRRQKAVIKNFFYIENGSWRHSRLEKEWKKVQQKIYSKRPPLPVKRKPRKTKDTSYDPGLTAGQLKALHYLRARDGIS